MIPGSGNSVVDNAEKWMNEKDEDEEIEYCPDCHFHPCQCDDEQDRRRGEE